jgi:ferredoxin
MYLTELEKKQKKRWYKRSIKMADIKIKVKDREGVVHELEAPTDMNMNLMEICKAYELPVAGICGGMAMCASCQCYIVSDHNLPEVSHDEEAMLSEAFYVKDSSRLGCQLPITEDLEGLEIELAPE